jgi:hypothetical protein
VTTAAARLRAGVPTPLRERLADPAVRRLLLLIGSAAGYGVGISAAVLLTLHDGGLGYDSQAYWLAGQNVLHGQPLYGATEVDAFGAYKYPPLFAQLWAPLTLIPALAFSWLWRFACLLSVRWLAGSWRNVGLWLLVPFTITELSLANVTFPVAVMVVLALRGQGWLATAAAALKIGPVFVLPFVWLTNPAQRRSLVIGTAGFGAACLLSFVFDPAAWAQYADSLFRSTSSEMSGFGVVALAPTGAVDLGLRLAIALGMTAVALRLRSDRLVFAATVISVPIFAVFRLAPLLVLPRLGRRT